MYKIEFIPTGHIFELPDITAEELKENPRARSSKLRVIERIK